MFSNFIAYGAGEAGNSSGIIGVVITIALWIGIFYLFLIRPNKKKQKKHTEMINSLQPGQEILTTGGVKGEVVSIVDNYIVVRVDKGVKLHFAKDSIRAVL